MPVASQFRISSSVIRKKAASAEYLMNPSDIFFLVF